MELLIVHSQGRTGEIAGLVGRLNGAGVAADTLVPPPSWDVAKAEALTAELRAHSHWLLVPSAEDRAHPAFVFAVGFGAGTGERCWVYDDQSYGAVPHLSDLGRLVETISAERARWELTLARRLARDQLAEQGFDVSPAAFFEAAQLGDAGTCRLFLRAGFSPDLADKKGVSVLAKAVRAGHLAVARLLLDEGADLNHRSRDRDNSALMDAAAEGQTDLVAELLSRGADLAGVSRNGQNALVLAVGKGAEDAAALLLDAGADPFVTDKLGSDAVQYARLLGRLKFLALVTKKFPERV